MYGLIKTFYTLDKYFTFWKKDKHVFQAVRGSWEYRTKSVWKYCLYLPFERVTWENISSVITTGYVLLYYQLELRLNLYI